MFLHIVCLYVCIAKVIDFHSFQGGDLPIMRYNAILRIFTDLVSLALHRPTKIVWAATARGSFTPTRILATCSARPTGGDEKSCFAWVCFTPVGTLPHLEWCFSMYTVYPSIYLPAYLPANLSIYLSIYLSIWIYFMKYMKRCILNNYLSIWVSCLV